MEGSCLVSESKICRNCRYPLAMDSAAFSITGDEIYEKSWQLPPDSLSLYISAGRIIMVWVFLHLPNFMFMFLTERLSIYCGCYDKLSSVRWIKVIHTILS